MNFAITIQSDRQFGVDLRELHGALESRRDFSTWAKANLADFVVGWDYEILLPRSGEQVHGGHNRIDYAVSIDCAKHIAMMERTDQGQMIRRWFIEREKELHAIEAGAPVKIPSTLPEALRLAADLAEKADALALEVQTMQPKAEFYDAVTASDDTIQLAVACQVLGLPFGRNTLFQRLRERGVLITGGERHNLPKQRYVEQGLFTVKESTFLDENRQPRVGFTPLVTQKGLDWLRKEFGRAAA